MAAQIVLRKSHLVRFWLKIIYLFVVRTSLDKFQSSFSIEAAHVAEGLAVFLQMKKGFEILSLDIHPETFYGIEIIVQPEVEQAGQNSLRGAIGHLVVQRIIGCLVLAIGVMEPIPIGNSQAEASIPG